MRHRTQIGVAFAILWFALVVVVFLAAILSR
jgi:hypothetical protein